MISDVIFLMAVWCSTTLPCLDHPLFILSPLGRRSGCELICPADLTDFHFLNFEAGLAFFQGIMQRCLAPWKLREQ